MEEGRRRKRRFFTRLVLLLLLIMAGLVMIVQTFTKFGQVILNNQDAQLYHLAQSVDRNITSLLKRCEDNLRYVTGRRGFLEAQATWQDTGEAGDLLFRLQENLLAQDELISVMLAMEGDEVFLSTDGVLDYTFSDYSGSDRLRPCTGPNGTIYLAFLYEAAEDLRYAALMDLDEFYRQIVSNDLAEYDWVLLTDASSEILLHHQQGQVLVEAVDAVSGATCGGEGVDLLLSYQERQVIGTSSYEYLDKLTQKNYTARMVVLPSEESENAAFAVGVVTNFEDVVTPLNQAAVRLLCYGGMVAVGVLLLVIILVRFGRGREQDQLELKTLREKNEAMEELNRQTQELAHHQRLETIGTLTSSIAHEFNNLLTPIMGYSILTLEQLPPENEELCDNVLEIYNASRKAKDIISRLSELSRKNTSLTFQTVSLDELVHRVLHVATPARPAGVMTAEQLNCGDRCVLGNETQLSQLLLNLLLNAFQAMGKEGGTVTISTGVEEDEVFLRVQDTGPGIPADVLPQIFNPFFTTKESGKGTGLGLAIVQQVVSEHGGEITVDTEEGRGCIFTVRLPLASEESLHTDE